VAQEFITRFAGRMNRFQVRLDVLNFTNLINKNWGNGDRLVSNTPLTNPSANSAGELQYRLRAISGELMSKTFEQTSGINDVFRIGLSLRYMFD
jgi:hypothetical protein